MNDPFINECFAYAEGIKRSGSSIKYKNEGIRDIDFLGIGKSIKALTNIIQSINNTEIPNKEPRYISGGYTNHFVCSRCATEYHVPERKHKRFLFSEVEDTSYYPEYSLLFKPSIDTLTGGLVCEHCIKELQKDTQNLYLEPKEYLGVDKKVEVAERLLKGIKEVCEVLPINYGVFTNKNKND